jgi:hypothetical protein
LHQLGKQKNSNNNPYKYGLRSTTKGGPKINFNNTVKPEEQARTEPEEQAYERFDFSIGKMDLGFLQSDFPL